jgi:hypothetical protein
MKQNKGTILKCTVDYIKYLKRESERHKANLEKFRETEELNSKRLLRIQVSIHLIIYTPTCCTCIYLRTCSYILRDMKN